MKAYEKTLNLLTSLKLKGILRSLDEIVSDAETGNYSYISFLNNIFQAEIEERVRRRFEKNMSAAHFPVIKKADGFDFGRIKGICKSETVNLLDCRWIDKKENLLFFGPPGIGNYVKYLLM